MTATPPPISPEAMARAREVCPRAARAHSTGRCIPCERIASALDAFAGGRERKIARLEQHARDLTAASVESQRVLRERAEAAEARVSAAESLADTLQAALLALMKDMHTGEAGVQHRSLGPNDTGCARHCETCTQGRRALAAHAARAHRTEEGADAEKR